MPEATGPNNPCVFKNQCKTCTKAFMHDRPHFCVQLGCEFYTPCTRCRMNRVLDVEGLCNVCVKEERGKREEAKATAPLRELDANGDLQETTLDLQRALELDETEVKPEPRKLSLSSPGNPPSEYSNIEKEIYQAQWDEYKGFYRDPTAKFTVHSIIILEIELNWLLNEMINRRGSPDKNQEQQRLRLIRSLSELQGQLPKREANDESDDEKFISMIYDKYVAELKERRVGRVSRLLSPEAIALAPVLHFPIDPQELLTNCGYRMVDAVQACSHIILDDLPKEPEKLLEFFGFLLQEKYALPIETLVTNDEEEPLPAIANPSELETDQATLDDDSD
jgi:hypothetical protein